MSKLQLILSDSDFTSFEQPWLRDILNNYVDMVFIEHDPIIDPRGIAVTNVINDSTWYLPLINNGHRLIVDNLWEVPMKPIHDHALCLTNKNWFCYNESLWYRHLGYHDYVPARNIVKNGLLLMNIKKPHRDRLHDSINTENFLYSYVSVGKHIEGDIGHDDINWQRYFNPGWYNSTAFSLIAETTVCSQETLFITEKTFKPIAFQHPFIIFGQTGVLKYLKLIGFETFENIFDESYDNTHDIDARLKNIVEQINNYSHKNYDLLTIEKMQHNKELFFNEELVKSKIIKEIVEPILEYAET
jgi:hypothetical protein